MTRRSVNNVADKQVAIRIGEWHIDATARVLDRHIDRTLWDQVAEIATRKYGWGDGLPVEITPLPSPAPQSDPKTEPGAAPSAETGGRTG